MAREPNPIGIPDGIDFGPPVIRTAVLTTGVYNVISGLIDTPIDTPIYRDHKDVCSGTYNLLRNSRNRL